jgi:cold shock CspA family protein
MPLSHQLRRLGSAAVQGFGFLRTDSGEEFFCHISNVKLKSDNETLQEGDLMQFSTKTEYDGRLQVRTMVSACVRCDQVTTLV